MMRPIPAVAMVLLACSGCGLPCSFPRGNPDDFPDAETTKNNWQSGVEECADEEGSEHLVVSECQGGNVLAVSRGTGFTSLTHFFDSEGKFLGLRETWDVIGPPCYGRSDWPVMIDCQDGVVTEVVCPSWLNIEVGQGRE